VGCTEADGSSRVQVFLLDGNKGGDRKDGNHNHNHNTTKATKPLIKLNLTEQTSSAGGGAGDGASGIVSVQWQTKLNQLLVATSTHAFILYHGRFSKKGILLRAVTVLGDGRRQKRATRNKKKRGEDDLQQLYNSRAPAPGSSATIREQDIITPNALPMFQENDAYNFSKRRKLKKEQADTEHLRNLPQAPAKGMKATGTSSGATSTFQQYVMETTAGGPGKQRTVAGQDPREALFKYKEGKTYIGQAYKDNTEVLLADKTLEADEDGVEKQQK